MARGRALKNYMKEDRSSKKWIQNTGIQEHKGALHKELGVSEGKKIPDKKLEQATHSKNPLERKRANLAETLRGFKH